MDDIQKRIAERLWELRKEAGFSREQVARKLIVRQQTIEKYEKGLRPISLNRLHQCAILFKVSLKSFFE